MEIKQIRLARMAVFCYLTGDEDSKTCALIDPAFETDRILSEAQRLQMRMSLREKLFTLPGDTIVWPGHDYGPTPTSTIEHEQNTNVF